MTLVRSFIASTLYEGRTSHLVNDRAASAFYAKGTDDHDPREDFNRGVGASADDAENI